MLLFIFLFTSINISLFLFFFSPFFSCLTTKIENYAIERAEYLALTDIFSHPSNLKYGENLYWVKGKEPTCEDAVTAWYREILKYDFEKPRFSHDTGHFTQVVWRNTTQIGCAASQSPKTKKIYIVCNYYYPGNVLKHFKENVLYPSYW